MKQLMLMMMTVCMIGVKQSNACKTIADTSKTFIMPVEEVNFISGAGVAVTGKISEGMVAPGMALELTAKSSKTISVSVAFLSMYTKQIEKAVKGDHVTIVLKGVKLEEVKKGMILRSVGNHEND